MPNTEHGTFVTNMFFMLFSIYVYAGYFKPKVN